MDQTPAAEPARDAVAVVESFWKAAEAREWDRLGSLLAPDVRYVCPQTRELVRGREAYVRFNRAFPGDWHLTIDRIDGGGSSAVSLTTFVLGAETMTGIGFFDLDADGLISAVTDFWPEPYEPNANRAHLVERY